MLKDGKEMIFFSNVYYQRKGAYSFRLTKNKNENKNKTKQKTIRTKQNKQTNNNNDTSLVQRREDISSLCHFV